MGKPKKTNPEFETLKFIVGKFCAKELINWPKEIKIAKKLLKKYNRPGFWEYFDEPQSNTLVKFLTKEYDYKLEQSYAQFLINTLQPKEEPPIVLQESMVGENIKTQKTLSLEEFLDTKF